MKKPVLVVMAAGMGSRYGGLKQIDPVDKEGHIIMDFSIYDAVQAGFQKVVFIIKKEMKQTSEAPSVTASVISWKYHMFSRIFTIFRKAMKYRKDE